MTHEVFEALTSLAREFNEYVPPDRVRVAAPSSSDAKGDRPGDHYNRRASWSDVLEPHGWRPSGGSGAVTYWTRPGKAAREGHSATTGKCKSDLRGDLLYNFSSNGEPFESETAYDKFAAYTLLEHGGDFKEAAKRLQSLGYGNNTRGTVKFPAPDGDEIPQPEPLPTGAEDVAGIDDLKRAGAEVRWLWPGWVQMSVLTAVAAEGGTGKTRLMADLVRRVRHGLTWPDGEPIKHEAKPFIALWVVSDNHHDEMVSLCDAFGISDCVKINAHPSDPYGGVTLELPEDFAMLERRIKLVNPLMVIVDTVGNATDKNMSKQEDAKAFYQPLQLVARRNRTALFCLTHLNAGGKVLGRRALEKVRTCIRLSAERINDTKCKRRLEVTKSNSKYPMPLGITMGDAGNDYDDQAPPSIEEREAGGKKVSESVKDCAEWLREQVSQNPRTVVELREEAEKKGWFAHDLYDAKRHLGLIEKQIKNRKWWCGENGEPKVPQIMFGDRLVED